MAHYVSLKKAKDCTDAMFVEFENARKISAIKVLRQFVSDELSIESVEPTLEVYLQFLRFKGIYDGNFAQVVDDFEGQMQFIRYVKSRPNTV